HLRCSRATRTGGPALSRWAKLWRASGAGFVAGGGKALASESGRYRGEDANLKIRHYKKRVR
ncbi:MAG TPA: hypothetical protein VKF79_05980, partial [Candidatus Acidoferrum sp.]|nr:hypothetical protein [Candidatus Acidoferrum sp.]